MGLQAVDSPSTELTQAINLGQASLLYAMDRDVLLSAQLDGEGPVYITYTGESLQAVPEPTALALALAGAVMIVRKWRA